MFMYYVLLRHTVCVFAYHTPEMQIAVEYMKITM